jgi:hypothetical protein
MEMEDVIKKLRNLRKKWRTEVTRERKYQQSLIEKYKGMDNLSLEKSVGIDIGYSMCSSAVDKLIKELEKAEQDYQDELFGTKT